MIATEFETAPIRFLGDVLVAVDFAVVAVAA